MGYFKLDDALRFTFSFHKRDIQHITSKLARYLEKRLVIYVGELSAKTSFYNSFINGCKCYYSNSQILLILKRRKYLLFNIKVKILLDSNKILIYEGRVENYYGKDFFSFTHLYKYEIEMLCSIIKDFIKEQSLKK